MPVNKNDNVVVLDCTLRDGGYFTDWQFDKKLAQSLVTSLNKAGVRVIEIGYKSPAAHKLTVFEGLFRFCTESQLGFLQENQSAEYAFMIDAKEYLAGQSADPRAISETIVPCASSLFDWVRVATYSQNIPGCSELVPLFKDLGYKVTLNLMGMSLLSEKELHALMEIISEIPVDVFYFSDSFGDLVPADVSQSISLIRQYYTGKLGIHTHDSNGLAFANTIEAIRLGVDFVDATVLGMGRGAGNLRTEQILLYLYFKENYTHLNPSELLEIIDTCFVPLKNRYGWGWDYTYMLSALQNIHPTYCMNLRAGNQYTIEQVSAILNGIEPSKRQSYNEDALLRAVDIAVNRPLKEDGPLIDIPPYTPVPGEKFLVIATGPGREQYEQEIREFIRQHQPVVIECNPRNDAFESVSAHYLSAILNWVRLSKLLDHPRGTRKPVITGIQSVPQHYLGTYIVQSVRCHVKKDEVLIDPAGLTLPAYVVGMYAVGLALLSRPKALYVAGFDGYPDVNNPKQQEMITFWKKLPPDVPVLSLTPTSYPINVDPIFRFIK